MVHQGESTLWGAQLGEFHDMCVKYTITKCVAFNLSFIFGVWTSYFDFQKVNVI
jgi:hypothetical protein